MLRVLNLRRALSGSLKKQQNVCSLVGSKGEDSGHLSSSLAASNASLPALNAVYASREQRVHFVMLRRHCRAYARSLHMYSIIFRVGAGYMDFSDMKTLGLARATLFFQNALGRFAAANLVQRPCYGGNGDGNGAGRFFVDAVVLNCLFVCHADYCCCDSDNDRARGLLISILNTTSCRTWPAHLGRTHARSELIALKQLSEFLRAHLAKLVAGSQHGTIYFLQHNERSHFRVVENKQPWETWAAFKQFASRVRGAWHLSGFQGSLEELNAHKPAFCAMLVDDGVTEATTCQLHGASFELDGIFVLMTMSASNIAFQGGFE